MHDPRTLQVPEAILSKARELLSELGPIRGGKRLGISRNALLSILATGRAMPGTLALIERATAESKAA
jgi:hypothetical protein